MEQRELVYYFNNLGKDPSVLIFEDELTGLHNRRFVLNYFQHKIDWDSLDDNHVSLLMMDVDFFKQVNDTHGHNTGDRALVHVADLLKELSGESGLPIRHGGDEFMILLPGSGKKAALALGEKLIQAIHSTPLTLAASDHALHLTLSIGVATAPDDAENGALLMQKADTALYLAKRLGRDRVADVAEAAAEDIFPKTAIQNLEKAKIAGRKDQLALVANALKQFSRGKSRFLIVEGASGMGKSSFLRTVQQNLENATLPVIGVEGTPQELFRPYYLISAVLIKLLNRRKDNGKALLDALSPAEIENLSFVLPQLIGASIRAPEGRKRQREEIFQSLVRFFVKLVDAGPFLVFVDDLHYTDEASLHVFRSLILRMKIPVLFCGATSEFQKARIEINPLQRFCQSHARELDIQRIQLTPLSETDITEHLAGIFPSFVMPANFEKELAGITDGNPLFLAEILNKLVHDRKIVLFAQQWIFRPLEQGYLSLSLDEIISQKIASFDEESRRLLEHTATFGEMVSLSMLTGSSEEMETKVLEILDKAKLDGLVRTEFRVDDEYIRFLSKGVQEIVYGGIQKERKEQLHEKIAIYQEKLFEKRLLPSAAILAWHFSRSANLEKARTYEQQHQEYSATVFAAAEALDYTGDFDAITPDIPLDPEALKELPRFFRTFLIALRGTKLYPPSSKVRTDALRQFKNILDGILATNERLRVAADKHSLIVNGETIDTAAYQAIAEDIRTLFVDFDLSSLSVSKECTESELNRMLEALGSADHRKLHPRFWQQVSEECDLGGIELKQVRYTAVKEEQAEEEAPGDTAPALIPEDDAPYSPGFETDQNIRDQIIPAVSGIIGALMGAQSKTRLYPLDSSVITDAIAQVMAALEEILPLSPALTLAAVESSLLVNGVKVDKANSPALAAGFVQFLQSVQLNSITFLPQVSSSEVTAFLAATIERPSSDGGGEFWRHLAKEKNFKGLLFNERLYAVLDEIAAENTGAAGDEVLSAPEKIGDDVLSAPEKSGERVGEELPEKDLAELLGDLFLRGEDEALARLLKRTFQGYRFLPVTQRKYIVEACGKAIGPGRFAPIPRFLKPIAERLREAIGQEEEMEILERLAGLLQDVAFLFLQYGEYALAGWAFTSLRERIQEIGATRNGRSQNLFQTALPSHVLTALREDIKSSASDRQQEATLFLSTMDERILPLLLDVIKQEEDLRVRQLAANAIVAIGKEAVAAFKRELVLEGTPEERIRMLEIADVVSRDLHVELSYALGGEELRVRRAAFRLAERLKDDRQIVDLLHDFAQAEEAADAIPAIRTLGKIKAAGSVPILVAVIAKAKEQKVQIACCHALGQIGDSAGMEPLIRILAPKGLFSLQKKHSDNLRAAAAFALAQIPHPRVAEVMKSCAEDRDPRIRQTARKVVVRRPAKKR